MDNKSNNKNDFIFYMLKIILLFSISVAGCIICLMLARHLISHAEDTVDTYYIAHWAYSDSQFSTERTFEGEFELGNDHPTALIHLDHNGMYQLCEYIEEEEKAYYMSFSGNHTGAPLEGHYTVKDKNDKIITNLEFPAVETSPTLNAILSKFYSVSPMDSLVVTSNMYVFDSLESATAYYRDGDGSGILQRPPIPDNDDDYHHDFSKDTYDADMPIPELSDFSHNGFTVNNARDDLFISIIVESKFYGVMHNTSTLKFYLVNKNWAYASHYYNIGDLSDIAVNESKINIKDLWGVDNEGALVKDFKKWSEEYPTHVKLPDYSFWKHGSFDWQTAYQPHTVNSNASNLPDALAKSRQASTTFYVRFYDKNMNYSKWIGYRYSTNNDMTENEDTFYPITDPRVDTGEVIPDKEGNPTIPDPTTGRQDPNTGDVDYSYGSGGKSTFDSSDLWATIQNLVNNMGAIPELIGEVLSFLPQWVLYMIAAGIAACVILRFVGR